MSEATPEPAAPPAGETPAEPKAEETDWKSEARKWEQRAKDNKGAADQLAALEESKKSELQKERERAEAAEKRATEFERTALRTRIAAEMNVPVEVLQGDDEDTVKASAQRVLDWANTNKKPAPTPRSLASGSVPKSTSEEKGRAAAALRSLRQG